MKKFKLGFTIKYYDEVELTEEGYQEAMKVLSKGKELVSVEDIKEELADLLGTSKECLKVIDHQAEIICEGKGE